MSDVAFIYYKNDMLLEVSDLENETTGLNINNATVTVTLVDSTGANVVGDVWPKAMTYVTGSNGIYQVNLLNTMTLIKGARYTAQIAANGGAGLVGYWEKDLICQVRK
jgi:hypothetical protein